MHDIHTDMQKEETPFLFKPFYSPGNRELSFDLALAQRIDMQTWRYPRRQEARKRPAPAPVHAEGEAARPGTDRRALIRRPSGPNENTPHTL